VAEPETWIKLNRNIIKWGWYQNANTMRVFIHLLLKANINDGKIENINYRRGQLVTSYGKLSKELSLSTSQIRTAMGHLAETEEIQIKPINGRFVIVTIKNYDKYQGGEDSTQQEPKPRQNQRRKNAPKQKSNSGVEKKPDKYIPMYWETEIPEKAWGRFKSPEEYQSYVDEHREEALTWVTN